MDFEIFNETKKILNNPLINSKLTENKHLIFIKYTSELYYKYSIEQIETLCKKSKFENKKLLFHTTLNFLLRILYNCGNTPCLNNLDLLILCTFSLGIKSVENRFKSPSINRLKKIYPEKYSEYQNDEIKLGEIICIKMLNYNINILTPYECLFYLLYTNNDLNLFDKCIQHLDNLIINGDKNFIYKKPIDIAEESIKYIKIKEKEKINIHMNDVIKKYQCIFGKNTTIKTHKILRSNASISTYTSSNNNKSNIINNSIYSSEKKSLLKNNFKDINISSERFTYSNYFINSKEKKEKNKDVSFDSDKVNLDYIKENNEKGRCIYLINNNNLSNSNKIIKAENPNKFNDKNNHFIYNHKTKNIHIKNNYKNSSAKIISDPPVFEKELKTDFIIQTDRNKLKNTTIDKNDNSININTKNNIINKGINFRNVNNNISLRSDKLNELCKKMNFDVFATKIK